MPNAEFILEPFGRNSAPAIAAACLVCAPEELLLILSADHHIEKPQVFLNAVKVAEQHALSGSIVTFGIQPTFPATTYGYIEAAQSGDQVKEALNFVEKPEAATAENYLKAGRYFWNAGIFLFKAGVMLDAFERYSPRVLEQTRAALGRPSQRTWNLDPERFQSVENISIDYAIMERSPNIQVLPVDMGWSDVGGYDALWEMSAMDDDSNVTHGPVVVEKSNRLFVRSEGPVVCVSGLKDCVVIATPDNVMVTPRKDPSAVKLLGTIAQARHHSLPMTEAIRNRAKTHLWNCFDAWSKNGWDDKNGGFVEQLNLDGTPDIQAARRTRVQARQVFSFARSIGLGWSGHEAAHDLVAKGLHHLDTVCKHPDGGWAHLVDAKGIIVDPTRDLYDHAFVMTAGAAAYQATGNEHGLEIAEEAIAFVDEVLLDEDNGGYFESVPRCNGRRANPHMHLLEAFLILHGATRNLDYLSRANEIVDLFESKLFSPKDNILREGFNDEWSPLQSEEGRIFEPGHHYEWSSLLAMHDKRTNRDTGSWRRRMILKADRFGRDSVRGLAYGSVLADGTLINANQRIWQQLEMFRARLLHPETAAAGDANKIFEMIELHYFGGMPFGTWRDEIDAEGKPISNTIPASILYHLVSTLSPAFISDPRQLGPRPHQN